MAHEHLLCIASGIDGRGNLRSFKIYKLRGEAFTIHNDRGHKHTSYPSRRVNESDIKAEIHTAYHVGNIALEGDIEEAKFAATWPKSCNKCKNCGCSPIRRAYGRKGYCGLCHSMVEGIAALTAWDRAKPATSRWVPKSAHSEGLTSAYYSDAEFDIWRASHVRQAEERLAWLRAREQRSRGEVAVDITDIEEKLTRLIRAIRRKAKLSKKVKGLIGLFDAERRHTLHILLDEIEDHILWRGFNSQDAYDLIHRYKVANAISGQ
jgi:hypothetical protein